MLGSGVDGLGVGSRAGIDSIDVMVDDDVDSLVVSVVLSNEAERLRFLPPNDLKISQTIENFGWGDGVVARDEHCCCCCCCDIFD